VAHQPSSLNGAEAHVASQLAGAYALLADAHEMRELVPVSQGLVRILKDCANGDGEPIAVRGTLLTLPMPLARGEIVHRRVAATGATDPVGPAARNQIGLAGIFVPDREHGVKLGAGKLVNGLGPTLASHGSNSLNEKDFAL
jgi:hypothetical protein